MRWEGWVSAQLLTPSPHSPLYPSPYPPCLPFDSFLVILLPPFPYCFIYNSIEHCYISEFSKLPERYCYSKCINWRVFTGVNWSSFTKLWNVKVFNIVIGCLYLPSADRAYCILVPQFETLRKHVLRQERRLIYYRRCIGNLHILGLLWSCHQNYRCQVH